MPAKNKCGGVGIYTSDSLTNVVVMEEIKLNKSCDCVKCETESLFIEFCYRDTTYTLGVIYRHPSGKLTHFISDLEIVLNQMDNNRTTVLAGDMNIDFIKFTNEEVVSYMTTLMSYGYLPYITIPSRITHHSMTCIDHIFVELSRREKMLNILSGLFYCEISDHLPCFISIELIGYVAQVKDLLQDYFATKTQLYLLRKWSQKSGTIFILVMMTTITNSSL